MELFNKDHHFKFTKYLALQIQTFLIFYSKGLNSRIDILCDDLNCLPTPSDRQSHN
jgi:hypothetical protein